MRVPFYARLLLLAALLAGGAGVALEARARYLPLEADASRAVLPGLRIDGQPVPDATAVGAFVAWRTHTVLARRVELCAADDPSRPLYEASLAELGVRVDEDAVARAAAEGGGEGGARARVEAGERARRGEIDVPLGATVDDAVLDPLLDRLKEAEDAQPVSARLDLEHHTTIPEKPGRYLDAFGALAALEAAARDPAARTVLVPVARVEPRVTSAFAAGLDVGVVLSEYETYFSRSRDQARRGKNIDVAASKLDGLVLSPGELVSFNAAVGDRSEENGFQRSWEIFKGEMVEGVGGGTCQAASTFHAVAFFAGLDIVERLPHSRPSAYIPMGLDATVVYPIVDLKVRNPHPFPVVLHAKTEGNRLKMELLGPSRPVRVAFGRELVKTRAYGRKVTEKTELTGERVVLKQHGIRGFSIKRKRLVTFADGTTKKEENTDAYPPTTEIYEVPVGFDASRLPPLPVDEENEATSAPTADASAPPSAPPAPTSAEASGAAPRPAVVELDVLEAPGAHAPTAAQANPAKTMWLRR